MLPLILNIDTALERAIISLSEGGKMLDYIESNDQKSHASILHSAINTLLKKFGLKPSNLDAIGLSIGPGSYTGLRVGMAAAKGLCYALKIPIINIGTLELLASNAIYCCKNDEATYCPMIDARRMEVYTALYDHQLKEILPPSAVILSENLFEEELENRKVVFFGSGALKFKKTVQKDNYLFENIDIDPQTMVRLAIEKFRNKEYVFSLHDQPLYIKEFYTISSGKKE